MAENTEFRRIQLSRLIVTDGSKASSLNADYLTDHGDKLLDE
ncbi:hypothetical protein [Haloquadratum walsbyi]|jgi:hypothetical protein|nr:hypothetical protein [Haloquadratum walsbyi]